MTSRKLDGKRVHCCDHPTGCKNTHPVGRFGSGQSQAGQLGWFFQKNGTSYCPEHVPDWVPAWRASRNR